MNKQDGTEMIINMAPVDLPADVRVAAALEQLATMTQANTEAIKAIASALQSTNERMTKIEREQRLATPVTSAQAKAINQAVRDRAQLLANDNRMAENGKAAAAIGNAIRKDLRIHAGVNNIRELPRCEYAVYQQMISMWDDFKTIKAIKAKHGGSAL